MSTLPARTGHIRPVTVTRDTLSMTPTNQPFFFTLIYQNSGAQFLQYIFCWAVLLSSTRKRLASLPSPTNLVWSDHSLHTVVTSEDTWCFWHPGSSGFCIPLNLQLWRLPYFLLPVLILLIWFKAGCKMLNRTHPTAGAKMKSKISGRESAANSTYSCTWASACGAANNEAAAALKPAAPIRPLVEPPLILLIWFNAGWRMLNNTHPIAGRSIPTRIKPLASLSAIVAISCYHDRNNDEDGGDIQKRRK